MAKEQINRWVSRNFDMYKVMSRFGEFLKQRAINNIRSGELPPVKLNVPQDVAVKIYRDKPDPPNRVGKPPLMSTFKMLSSFEYYVENDNSVFLGNTCGYAAHHLFGTFEEFKREQIRQWKEKYGYVHKAKIKGLRVEARDYMKIDDVSQDELVRIFQEAINGS